MKTTRLSEQVQSVLSTVAFEGNVVRLTCGKLDGKEGRKLYLAVDSALQALGGTWNRKVQGHVFQQDPRPSVENAILSGEVTRPQDFDFFETPEHLAQRMAESVGPVKRCVLEPSAGHGRLIRAMLAVSPEAFVDAFELIDVNMQVLNLAFADKGRVHVKQADFLATEPYPKAYQAVIMNPPFSKRGDVRHVLHAWKWLAPGGKMAAVMAAGVTFRDDELTRSLRALVNANSGTIDELPEDTFRESGTRVRTVLVTMRKGRAL